MLSIVWTALVRWYWLNCWQIFSLKIFIWGYKFCKFCKEHISPKFPKKLKPLSDIDLSHPKSPPHHPPLLAPGPDLWTVIWKYQSLSTFTGILKIYFCLSPNIWCRQYGCLPHISFKHFEKVRIPFCQFQSQNSGSQSKITFSSNGCTTVLFTPTPWDGIKTSGITNAWACRGQNNTNSDRWPIHTLHQFLAALLLLFLLEIVQQQKYN